MNRTGAIMEEGPDIFAEKLDWMLTKKAIIECSKVGHGLMMVVALIVMALQFGEI